MQVDTSVELGRDDPALEFPWCSEDGLIRYHDLKHNPELIEQVHEARDSRELRQFLLRINAPDCPLQTAKCDFWITSDISPEEEIFDVRWKFESYVDLIFAAPIPRLSLESHTAMLNKLCSLLQRAPEISATVQFIVRHCYYHFDENPDTGDSEVGKPVQNQALSAQDSMRRDVHLERIKEPCFHLRTDSRVGFCMTAYVSGFADDDAEARQQWAIALKLLENAIVQATRS